MDALERILQQATRSTRSTPRAIGFGIAVTTLLQSGPLVSVSIISFLGAGLIALIGG